MKIKKCIGIFILLFISSILTGCWDKIELEEEGYVGAIGLDKGKENRISITFQITNPKASGTGQSSPAGNEPKAETITFETLGPIVGRDIASISVTRRIDLAHAKALVVGEDFAQTDEFFHFLESALRDKQLRRNIPIMISREKASEFIKNNQPILEDRPQKFYEFMATRWKETALVPFSDLNRFMERVEVNESLFLAIYATTKQYSEKRGENEADFLPGELRISEENRAELIGSAVFKGGKMIGKLTGDETRLSELLREKPEFNSMAVSFPDPKSNRYRVAGRLSKRKKTKVRLDLSGSNPQVEVVVPISVEILAIASFNDYVENKANQEVLRQSIKSYMEQKSLGLIRKTQDIFGGEPFLWELSARRKFLKYVEFKNYKWMEKYPSAKVKVSYEVTLVGFGKQMAPPHPPVVRGKEGRQ